MSTDKTQVTPEEAEPVALAGDLLRIKREELGISQQEVADRLRLKVSVVKNIDNNVFDFDHVATFTRGYLRSYAKIVSLDEKLVMQALDGAKEAQHGPQSMQSFSRKTKRDQHDRRITKLSWIIFLVIFGISAVWWYQNQQDTLAESSQQEINTPASATAEEPTTTPAPVLLREEAEEPASPVLHTEPATETSDMQETESAAEPQVAADESVEPVQEEVITEAVVIETEEPEVIAEDINIVTEVLTMNFDSDCWIQVKDATGKSLAIGVKKAGHSLRVEGQLPYSVILGAPEGVSMTFANEPVDLSGYTSGKVARFTLP